MKRIFSILAIVLVIASCRKENIEIPDDLINENQYLSEEWQNNVLVKKLDYENGKMIRNGSMLFLHVNAFSIQLKGSVGSECIAMYDMDNQLSNVHYFTEAYFPKNDHLTWDQRKLVEYRSTQTSLLTAHDRVVIDSFKYNGDQEVEIRSYTIDYYHNVKTNETAGPLRRFKWFTPFVLREYKGDNEYVESRFSANIKSADYNIVNFPWLTNKIDIADKNDLMNMVVGIGLGYRTVSSRMLKIEERQVVNGKPISIRRLENLKVNKYRLPVSYDYKDLSNGTTTHFEFRYVSW